MTKETFKYWCINCELCRTRSSSQNENYIQRYEINSLTNELYAGHVGYVKD